MLIIGGAFVLYVWLRERSLARAAVLRYPPLRGAFIGFLVLTVLGYLLNDSGVAIPGALLAVLTPVLACLLLDEADAVPAGPDSAAGEEHRARAMQAAVAATRTAEAEVEAGTPAGTGEPA
jgi:hypothetical protein